MCWSWSRSMLHWKPRRLVFRLNDPSSREGREKTIHTLRCTGTSRWSRRDSWYTLLDHRPKPKCKTRISLVREANKTMKTSQWNPTHPAGVDLILCQQIANHSQEILLLSPEIRKIPSRARRGKGGDRFPPPSNRFSTYGCMRIIMIQTNCTVR